MTVAPVKDMREKVLIATGATVETCAFRAGRCTTYTPGALRWSKEFGQRTTHSNLFY